MGEQIRARRWIGGRGLLGGYFVRGEMIGGGKYQIGPSCVERRLVSYRRGGRP